MLIWFAQREHHLWCRSTCAMSIFRMKEFLSGKLQDNNTVFTEKEEKAVNRKMAVDGAVNTVALGSFRWIRQHTPKKLRVKITNKLKKY